MEWKTDHRLFAKKILERIEKAEGDVTYTSLQERAIEKGIELDVLDRALEHLHRFKKVKQRVKGDEIIYRPRLKKVVKDPFAVASWVRDNYPYPTPCAAKGCTGICDACMPFPEWDLSWMFLTPDEMAEYKAQAKGMPLYLMQKKARDRIKKAVS
jgi:hypothetical protein